MTNSILITGHSSGIGQNLSSILHSKGYNIFGISRTTSGTLPSQNQFQADLSDRAGIQAACEFVQTKEINQIVHCAGFNIIKSVHAYSYDDWLRLMNVHCYSFGSLFLLFIQLG